jgi:hypothetical protein
VKAAPAAAKREKKEKQDKNGQDALLNHCSEGRNRLQPNLGSSMRSTLLAQLHMLQAQPAAEGSRADTCRMRKLIFVIAFHVLRSLSIVSAKLQKNPADFQTDTP